MICNILKKIKIEINNEIFSVVLEIISQFSHIVRFEDLINSIKIVIKMPFVELSNLQSAGEIFQREIINCNNEFLNKVQPIQITRIEVSRSPFSYKASKNEMK